MANSMLEAAVRLTEPGEAHLIVHSDCGCHYRWPGWVSICEEAGIIRSMSRKGCSPDNARMEGFFGTMKNEMFYGRGWEGVSLEGAREKGSMTTWRVVQHEEDQALAGLDEPLGIQAKPSPCSLARTVRKSGTTPV